MRIGLIQMCAGDEVRANIAAAAVAIREAAREGARLIATPEMTSLMDMRRGALMAKTRPEAEDEALPAFQALAAELGLTLLIGSLAIRIGAERCANRSYLLGATGDIIARYDKIHMFDVEVGDGQSYRESAKFEPGQAAVTAEAEGLKLGLTVCYDLRFPQLYRALAQAGAEILCVPAAFTKVTGEAHWHVLLRARAIETGSYVLAPAQGGRHADGRETFGHSLVVGPWGEILAEGGTAPQIVLAEIDPAESREARRRIPSLKHDRPFAPPRFIS
jgi:deaminated glutathione amidase